MTLTYINYMKEIKIVLKEDENLEDVMLLNKRGITLHLAKFLIWALENNMDNFSFAQIIVEGEDGAEFFLGCKREDYLEALRKQLNNLIEYEEYELCGKVREWIDYLKTEEMLEDNDD